MSSVSAAMIDTTPEYESWQRQFLQDLFHKLCQPLTALNGTLELALRKPMAASEYRETLGQAMELTRHLIGAVRAERESAESTDPGHMRPFDLVTLVRNVVEDLHPVLDDAGIAILLAHQGSSIIRADPDRIGRALFSLVDWSVQNNRSLHDRLLLWIGNFGAEVILYLGPTFNETAVTEDETTYFPVAAPHPVLINLLRGAGGRIQMLHSSNGTRVLLNFPKPSARPSVSSSANANFSE